MARVSGKSLRLKRNYFDTTLTSFFSQILHVEIGFLSFISEFINKCLHRNIYNINSMILCSCVLRLGVKRTRIRIVEFAQYMQVYKDYTYVQKDKKQLNTCYNTFRFKSQYNKGYFHCQC
jgi:hypothetical protein